MPADITYNRNKSATTNSTDINTSYEGSETPGGRAALVAGTTGEAEIFVQMDADESGGADVQDAWKVKIIPLISSTHPGVMTLTVEITPIKGDGTDGTVDSNTTTHDEDADAWQTAAGRARQA